MNKFFNHALEKDPEVLRQFENCCAQDFVIAAALMPDAHKGYVAPIGSVLITKGFIVPAWVGYDIGCGLIAVRIKGKNILEKIKDNLDKIHHQVNRDVPMGVGEYNKEKNISKETIEKFTKLLSKFEKAEHDKDILRFLKSTSLKHLGTLGGGNHFIELGTYKKEVWLIIHSGSRGIGHKVATKYMIKASQSKTDYERTFPLDEKSQLGKEYLNILDFGLEYALLNRLEMAKKVIASIEKVIGEKLTSELYVNKTHNHAIKENGKYIHRKGATPAKKGERGIIPGNMRDGSYLVEGLGNAEFLNSSSHGAGRIMSRSAAKKQITQAQFEKSMKGIKANLSEKMRDEAPMAYKNLDAVMQAQTKSVKIIKHIQPIMNWKG